MLFDPITSRLSPNEGLVANITPVETRKPLPSSVFAALPKNEPSSSILSNKPISPIEEKQLEQELEILLHKNAAEIESQIQKLSQQEKDQRAIAGALIATRYVYNYADFYSEMLKQGIQPAAIDFLQRVFPAEFMNEPQFKQALDLSYTILNLFTVFMHVIDTGSTGLILICHSRLLKASQNALLLAREAFEKEKDVPSTLSKEEKAEKERALEKKEKALNEWQANLNLEERELAYAANKFGWRTASRIFSSARILDRLLPSNSLIGSQAQVAFQGFGWMAAGFTLILSAIVLKRTFDDYSLYQEWVKDLEKKDIPVPTDQIAHQAQQLLNKRQQITKDKKKILKQKPPLELREQLKEFKRGEFNELNNKLEKLFMPTWFSEKTTLEHIEKQVEDTFGPIIPPQNSKLLYISYIKNHKEELFQEWFKIQENEHLEQEFNQYWNDLTRKLLTDHISTEDFRIQFETVFGISLPKDQQEFDAAYLHSTKNQIKKEWLETKVDKAPSESLMEQYIEHQETITQITKTSLKPTLQKKHSLEKSFLKFRLFESSTAFTILTISVAITAIVVLLGLSLNPAGSLAFFILTMATMTIGSGFAVAGFYLSFKKNPSIWSTSLFHTDVKSKCAKLRLLIQNFSRQSKYKKLTETATTLNKIRINWVNNLGLSEKEKAILEKEYFQAFEKYKKDKATYLEQCKKVDQWNTKIQELEQTLLDGYWKDFANHAGLSDYQNKSSHIKFDTLTAWQEALKTMDLELLDPDMKSFLNTQFGLDLDVMRQDMQNDSELLRKTLQKFFSLDNADLVRFIRQQQARKSLKLI